MGWLKIRRRLAVVTDRLGTNVGQNESDGAELLLEQMCDKARGTREYRHPLERPERIPGVKEHRRNRARNVQSQRLAGKIRQQALDLARNVDVIADRACFLCHRKQAAR